MLYYILYYLSSFSPTENTPFTKPSLLTNSNATFLSPFAPEILTRAKLCSSTSDSLT
jgi:hypothetical protein